MQVLLSHPEHGKAHAFTQSQLRDYLARGFVQEVNWSQSSDPSAIPTSFTAQATDQPTKRKPGRPRKVNK